jgi:PhnB protein
MHRDASVGLSFNGDCEAAFKLYESLLGGKAELDGKMLFARLRAQHMTLIGGDTPPGRYRKPTGFTLVLSADDEAEAERLFAALAEGGTVQMALQATFFAARYGEVIDRFGIPWEIRCRTPHGAASASP